MQIRHCVEESNVDDELTVIDPTKIRHVTIVAGRIDSMSGLVDPASHLNLDYPDHRVNICAITEKFEKGAKVRMDDDGLVVATVSRATYGHYGYVDYTQRLTDMIKAVKQSHERKQESK